MIIWPKRQSCLKFVMKPVYLSICLDSVHSIRTQKIYSQKFERGHTYTKSMSRKGPFPLTFGFRMLIHCSKSTYEYLHIAKRSHMETMSSHAKCTIRIKWKWAFTSCNTSSFSMLHERVKIFFKYTATTFHSTPVRVLNVQQYSKGGPKRMIRCEY